MKKIEKKKIRKIIKDNNLLQRIYKEIKTTNLKG